MSAAAPQHIEIDRSLVSQGAVTHAMVSAITQLVGSAGVHALHLAPNAAALEPEHGGQPELSGYVARAAGNTAADSPLVRALAEHAGDGVSWFELPAAAVAEHDDKAELQRLAQGVSAAAAAAADAGGVSVAHVVSREHFDTHHYIVARGGAAAGAAAAPALRNAAVAGHLTLSDVARSAELARAREAGVTARATAARDFAQSVVLGADDARLKPLGSQHNYGVARATLGGAGNGDDEYHVYNNAVDPSACAAGVMVYAGALAGYTWYVGVARADGEGRPTRGWAKTTAVRRGSLFAADTGRAHPASGRACALHPGTDATMATHAQRRLAWSGGAYNPAATHVYHAHGDLEWARTARELGAEPGGGAVSSVPLQLVCARLPCFDTARFPLDRQLRVAAAVPSARALPVRLDNTDVLRALVTHWPAVRARAATSAVKLPRTLAEALASERGDTLEMSVALLRAVHEEATAAAAATAADGGGGGGAPRSGGHDSDAHNSDEEGQ